LSFVRAPSVWIALLLGSSPCPRESFLQGACPEGEDRFRPSVAPDARWGMGSEDTAAEPSPCDEDPQTCEGEFVVVVCRESWCEPEWSGRYCVERAELDTWASGAGYELRCAASSDGYAPFALEPICCHSCGA
jgi:hypothetical protein